MGAGSDVHGDAADDRGDERPRHRDAELRAGDLMVRRPVTVAADRTLAEFMDEVAHAHHFTTYPVTEDGRVLGLLPFACVARVPRAEWETRRVGECIVPREEVPVLRAEDEIVDVFTELAENEVGRGLVLDGERLVGLLSVTDVGRVLSARRPPRPAR